METMLYPILGAVALLTIIGLAITNRSGNRLTGPAALAKHEEILGIIGQLQSMNTELAALDPSSPDAAALKARIATFAADIKARQAAMSKQNIAALRPMMTMNIVGAGIAGVFALGAIGWLVYTQPSPFTYGAALFIVAMLFYGTLGMRRTLGVWKMVTRDRSVPPATPR